MSSASGACDCFTQELNVLEGGKLNPFPKVRLGFFIVNTLLVIILWQRDASSLAGPILLWSEGKWSIVGKISALQWRRARGRAYFSHCFGSGVWFETIVNSRDQRAWQCAVMASFCICLCMFYPYVLWEMGKRDPRFWSSCNMLADCVSQSTANAGGDQEDRQISPEDCPTEQRQEA